jgi:hypothetical protein
MLWLEETAPQAMKNLICKAEQTVELLYDEWISQHYR